MTFACANCGMVPVPDDGGLCAGCTPPTLTVEQVAQVRRLLYHDVDDWLRNAHRALDGIVQEQTQGETVDLDHLRQDATAAHVAVLNAIRSLGCVADGLAPYACAPARVDVAEAA